MMTASVMQNSPQNQARNTIPLATATFRKTFVSEFTAYKQDLHTLSGSGVAYPHGWLQWFQVGIISFSSIALSTTFGFLSAYQIIGSPVAVGIGFAISLGALVAGIGFDIYLYFRSKHKYERLNAIMTDKNADDISIKLADKIVEIYSDKLKIYNEEQAKTLAGHCMNSISGALQVQAINHLDELLAGDTLKTLLQKESENDHVLDLPDAGGRNSFNTREIIMASKSGEHGKVLQAKPVSHADHAVNVTLHGNNNQSDIERFFDWVKYSLFGIKRKAIVASESHVVDMTPANKQA